MASSRANGEGALMQELDRQAIIRVKQQLAHLFKPNPWIYWSDLFVSVTIAWGTFAISLQVESLALKALCLFVSTYATYRMLIFTHELEHLNDGALPYFRPVWHVLCGAPYCMPHFIYRGLHRIHHSTRYYGTPEDPEYVPFVAQGSFREPLKFFVLAFVFPIAVAMRYLVLAPLSLFSSRLRTFVVTKASGFVMQLDYARRVPTGREMTIWRIEEATTVIFVWTIMALILTGVLPAAVLLHWFIVLASIMVLNGFRGLAATHHYASNGEVMSFEDHIAESVNLNKFSLLNELVAPLGLTLHATHHIFPTLPYYALPKAHRLLMQQAEGEGKPLGFYLTCQWSTLDRSIPRMIQLTKEGKSHVRSVPEVTPIVPAAFPDF
jgi:fatty acid desaturase